VVTLGVGQMGGGGGDGSGGGDGMLGAAGSTGAELVAVEAWLPALPANGAVEVNWVRLAAASYA
jgi:hypothetical protein